MWTPTKTKKYGVAIYNWRGDVRYGLPLEIGDTVQILEECVGWYRGFTTKNRSIKGIFPQSYIFLKPCKVDNEGLFESVVPLEEPVIREVTLVLREWGTIWKKLYISHSEEKVKSLLKSMCELLEWRRQLMSGTLTHDQTRDLKLKIIAKIDCGNRELGLDLVPRQGAQAVDPDTMSVVELYQVHANSAECSRFPQVHGFTRRKEPKKILTHHLYFCMRDFGYHIGEDTEIYFSLYDSKKQKYISERFLVKISKEGFSNYVEKLHSNCTIFTDLGNAELSRDLYLVTHVLRLGRMLYSESSKRGGTTERKEAPPTHMFRRPHAVAALNLSEMISPREGDTDEKEFTFKVYQTEEKDFHQLHEQIIKQNGKFNTLSGQPNYGIVISLKMLHGELSQVREENPLLFKNTQLTRKLGFADVIMPGDVRNDLYLTLEHGEFERGGKSTGKNIEVSVTVFDVEGAVIENCLWGASGMEGTSSYHSMIIYHHNSPWWAENIRLTVPIDRFSGSHVRLEYRHCSTREKTDKKLFGFSFIRLMGPDGATIQDGQHELYIYKCEDATRLESFSYLNLPSNHWDNQIMEVPNNSHSTFSKSQKESVHVRTLLCSTKLTQNVDLLSLLQWRAHPERIQESLTRVLRLGDEELVKFLQDVLDALFALFSTEDGNSTQHSGLVFHVLVSIFSLLDESKFQHFKPVMDAYIKGHFAAALVYKGLLSSVQHCADWVTSTEKQEPIQKCFRSLEYIFKLIIQSRLLFSRATGGQFEDSFKRDLYSVLSALNNMLASSNEVILPTQIALLQSMSAVFEQLTGVLPVPEVTRLASATLDALPRDISPQLTQAKLCAIRHLVTTKLFHDDESRNILLTTLCRHLRLHLARRDELRLCTETLSDIISYLYKQRRIDDEQGKVNNCIHHDVDTLCINTLDMLIQTVLIIIDRNTAVLGSLVACLIGLFQLLDEYHYTRLWEDLMGPTHDRKPLKDFLLRVFLVFRDLVKQQVFPNDWLVIRMAANNVMLRALQELAQPLAFKFLDSRAGHFDNQLWSNYFNLAVAYLTQQSLQLEQFSEVKREKIIEKYGDMRVLMGFQILSMWSHLGEHKLHFIPSMVGPFLEVTLVPEWELRKATLHIFFDMMECEQRARGSFKQVEAELIDKLDILISENKGDDEYKQLFNTMLLDRVQSEDPAWKDSGTAFISSVTRLLERLLDYRSVIQGDENRDKRMSCTVNLLKFYKNEINRKEMYLRYIHKLHDLHIGARNFTEAACTLQLYADQLSWSVSTPVSDPNYPGIPECQLKLMLYNKIIEYFDLGKCWEKGIPLLKELAILYETREFNYVKLSQVLKLQATFFDNILKKTRLDPEYFRVGFYGLGFPLFVRNKQFIYRGEECEKMGDFTHRLLTEFPCAQILTKISAPEDAIVNSDGQYIQIYNVKPIPEPNPIFSGIEIPDKIARFYHVNEVRRFKFDRVVHKGLIDKDNEFKSQWKERTILITENSLPGILRWFEVVETYAEELAPIQVACDNMRTTVQELRTLLAHNTDKPDFFKQLSMKLKGIIVPEVQGGLIKYHQAFFTNEFAKLWPDHIQYANELRSILQLELVPLLETGLNRYGRLAPPELQPLHTVMCQGLNEIRYNLGSPVAPPGARLHRTDSIINTPLPPLPIEKKSNTLDGTSRQSIGSSVYAHYGEIIEDDGNIYSKPMDVPPNRDSLTLPMNSTTTTTAPPIPQRETRPRSQGFVQINNTTMEETVHTPANRVNHDYSSLPSLKSRDSIDATDPALVPPPRPTHHRERSLTKLPSPKLPLRHSLPTPTDSSGNVRNSWPENSNGSEEAPPLPPRGQTPDKRGSTSSLEAPPNIPRRLQKKSLSVFNAEVTDSLVDIEDAQSSLPHNNDQNNSIEHNNEHHDLRDSGISTASLAEFGSTMNNLNNLSYEDFDLRAHKQSVMNLNISPPTSCPKLNNPPPIPPKSTMGHHHSASLGSSIDLGGGTSSLERRRESDSPSFIDRPVPDNYSIPRLQETIITTNESSC